MLPGMMQVGFYGGVVGGGVPSGITFAVQDIVTGTTTGNVDYTSATISGVTPVAALMLYGNQLISSEPGETPAAQPCATIVANSGTGSHFRSLNMDNRADMLSTTVWETGSVFKSINQAFSGFDFVGTASLVSGGVRVNYTSATTSSRAYYVAFAGANVSSNARIVDLANAAGTQTVAAVGFEADVLLAFLPGPTASASAISQYSPCVGVAVNEGGGTIVQRCIATHETSAIATSKVYQAILTGKLAATLDGSGGKVLDVTAGNFTSTSYDLTTSAAAGNRDLLLLALKFTGGGKKLVDFTTPTSTGNHSVTGAGFTPRLALVFLTNLEAVDPSFPLTASDLMSGFSISAVGADEQWAMSQRVDNLAATSDTSSRVKASAILGANATSTNAIEATLVSFDSDGMTLNYSAVAGTGKKGFILFLQ